MQKETVTSQGTGTHMCKNDSTELKYDCACQCVWSQIDAKQKKKKKQNKIKIYFTH